MELKKFYRIEVKGLEKLHSGGTTNFRKVP